MANRWELTEQQKVVDIYLKGCVNLYGFVTPRQFLKVYNRYNTPKIKKDDLLRWGEKLHRKSFKSYIIYSNAIINSRVSEEIIDMISYYQNGKSYYMPTEEEIIAYADDDYYEKTEYTKDLYQFLMQQLKLPLMAANSFLTKLLWMIRIEEPISVQCELFQPYGIVPKDMKETQQLIEKIQNVNNNTRLWANCGYTPKEIVEEFQKRNM